MKTMTGRVLAVKKPETVVSPPSNPPSFYTLTPKRPQVSFPTSLWNPSPTERERSGRFSERRAEQSEHRVAEFLPHVATPDRMANRGGAPGTFC